jgi:hypothetical protein
VPRVLRGFNPSLAVLAWGVRASLESALVGKTTLTLEKELDALSST